uniref:E3 ubiquitin-protein ligase n=1 Tax=Meloidogyne hapla TaxID=6305 RepID=A0A1I8BIR7_MELHA
MSSIHQNDNKKLFSCKFRNLELCCVVGDILASNTDCIGAICDSNFSLTFGLTKAIKDAAGDDFVLNVQQARLKQSSSAISVRVSHNGGLRANYVILCPARRASRDSFDEIYNHFLNKAKELQIQSMTLPLLGTAPDVSIFVFSDSAGSNICGQSSSNNPGSSETSSSSSNVSANNLPNIDVSILANDDDSDDDNDGMHSFIDGDLSSSHSTQSMDDSQSVSDVSVSLDDSNLEDSDEEDDLSDLNGFDSESSADEDATPKAQKVRLNDESVFWSVIPQHQLLSSQNPTTSNNSKMTSSNLDDSTLPCSICLSDMRDVLENAENSVVQLSLCSHMFHLECIRAAFKVKERCPLCMCWYKDPIGYQPKDAKMTVRQIPGQVQGHRDAKGFHEITYHIPSGIQIQGHIRPGRPYRSMDRVAYLPNNKEGTQVLKMLQLAFKRRLIFTIGDSLTTGRKDVPIWNGIHHKTNKEGGPQSYGYPDPGYLSRVKEELAAVGVRSEQLKD